MCCVCNDERVQHCSARFVKSFYTFLPLLHCTLLCIEFLRFPFLFHLYYSHRILLCLFSFTPLWPACHVRFISNSAGAALFSFDSALFGFIYNLSVFNLFFFFNYPYKHTHIQRFLACALALKFIISTFALTNFHFTPIHSTHIFPNACSLLSAVCTSSSHSRLSLN